MSKSSNDKYVSLSKFLTLVLRHKPDVLNLELDKEGYVDLNKLLKKLRKTRKFHWVTKKDILKIVMSDDKGRFEIKNVGGKTFIRARYGHSANLDVEIKYEEVKPGTIKYLYHGTNSKVLPWILREGLKPMARKFVHLSPTPETAFRVGARRRGKVVILKIDVGRFLSDGGKIWKANDNVYLAEYIPPKYISIYKYGV